jgi:23S rRNA pseudouridine1911/1915/1917 synthase
MEWKAPKDLTVKEALELLYPGASKATLRSFLKEGRLHVQGKPFKRDDESLKAGQILSVLPKPYFLPEDVKLLYQDRDIAVIDKPIGLLSVSTHFEKEETAHSILKNSLRKKNVFPVHRLDQETSGLMMFALSEIGREKLKEDFEHHLVERCYAAIVEGVPDPSLGSWQSYLLEDANYVVRVTQDRGRGKLATTHYVTLRTKKGLAWIDLKLETGKKNQIRVHCQEAGHPIVGDRKYGSKRNPVGRLCLHAYSLSFNHPVTRKRLAFFSPFPESFFKLVP